jgi:hypothetical protein
MIRPNKSTWRTGSLTRPPDEKEMAIGADFLKKQSLVDFTHVLLNLNEFLYVR